jgi:hypothetical protein
METVNLQKIGVKAKSKREIYRLLTTEGDFYFPPEDDCPYDYIQ